MYFNSLPAKAEDRYKITKMSISCLFKQHPEYQLVVFLSFSSILQESVLCLHSPSILKFSSLRSLILNESMHKILKDIYIFTHF